MASTAGSTAVDTTVSGPQSGGITQRFQDFGNFLYNSEEGKVLGRTAKSWGEITLFYIIYYACLSGFFAGMLAVFYHTLDWNVPKLQGSDTLLKQNPGLAFRPLPNVETTLIRFNKARASTYTPYVDHIESFLQYYENEYQQTETGIMTDCSTFDKLRPSEDWDKACRFDIQLLGADCVKQQSFGYEDGQPCVLLKLNRIFDWMPEPYTNDTVPGEIADYWEEYSIAVHCYGENPSDKDNIGNIVYSPPSGFHFKYFPYRNQQGYRSPLVFVRFDDPNPAQLYMVTCKVYAKNIQHDSMERSGMVHFELMID
ncbi:sodium/potassium-transporting ATPase subunit beta-like isoform X1 [Ruditapes philippinarum]|uniref:sodium/potassium-transporting ATPase subunit beta-like isoform X1 n=1 Tax=Ruditapes philippinarum TaxID=129788 RepID=UPI00295B8080|nr:sodium/potassium-transporting ATPase subunit beta-like isoform X1 [Ruditapes philippinarum]